jgi:hypothetical protein
MSEYSISVDQHEYKISLSRVGPQGTRGASISRAYFDSRNHLMLEMRDANGTLVETLDAGDIDTNFNLSDITGFNIDNSVENDVLLYNADAEEYQPHSFTTSNLSDVDNTNRADGAMLLYSGTSEKYEATTTIDNANTTITGGNF